MRKIRKRVFAAVLAAALLFTMPGMSSVAVAEDAQTKDISESVTVQAEDDAAEETEAETEVIQESEAEDSDTNQPETGEGDTEDTETDAQEPAEEETVPTQKEDTKECTCGTLCTQDSINGDCPVCGAEDADLSRCKGEKTENGSEENKEDAGQEDTGAQDDSTNLCAHHKEHTEDCGYSRASEDGEESPCAYKCRICPIEDLIAALPRTVTEDNAEEVRAQLDEILDLYRELTEDEQEQVNLSLCWELQEALDTANAPVTAAVGDVILTTSNKTVTFTAEECSGNCQGHIITQNVQSGQLEGATIIVESGTHNITFSGINLTSAKVAVMSGATMSLTLTGTNTIQGSECGIYVPEGATLVIDGSGSLNVSANYCDCAAGIGGAYYAPNGELGNRNCGTVVINGGNITATGGSCSAGIGGAEADFDTKIPGNGGNITINGGNVTATGGGNSDYGGAGIGGGNYGSKSGSGGTLTINGGNVTLTAGHSTAYGFGRGSGSNSNAGTLTLADASYLTLNGSTLDPNGTYFINDNPTPDMIVVPTDLFYTGQALDLTGKIYIDDSKTGTATYFGQTFNVSASAEGWVLQDLGEVKEAGDYTVTFTKGGKSISTTFTVAACSHTGLVAYTPQAGNKHGGDCPDCGKVFSEEHTWVGGVCSVCGLKAAAQVEIGGNTSCYDTIDAAWAAANGNTAAITLLDDVTASETLTVSNGSTITFDGGDYTLISGQQVAIQVNGTFKLVSGTIKSNYSSSGARGINVNGTLEMTGGTVTASDNRLSGSMAVETNSNSNITISGGKISGVYGIGTAGGTVTIQNGETSGKMAALDISGGTVTIEGGTFTSSDFYGMSIESGTVVLRGGTFTGGGNAIWTPNSVASLLDKSKPYVYFDANGQPVNLSELEDPKKLPDGTYTVQECKHEGVKATANNNGTHSRKCPYCGYTEAAEDCSYGTEYQHDDTYHWKTCTACGYENKEAHTLKLVVQANGTVITASDACNCGYQKDLGTVTLTVPTNLIYHDGQTIAWTASEGLSPSFKWDVSGDGFANQPISAAGLDAGEHTLNIEVSHDSQTASSSIPVTVKPATLTAAMVTVAPESVTYSGAEQKPTITVKQGGTTLVEGTDYDVTYSTNDFTNVETIIITIKGEGNYAGTVEKTYTIKKAVLTTTGTGTANGTYGAKLSELSVSGLTAVYPGTTTEVPGTWKLTGDTIPGVGDSGRYTATFTPASGAGNYETLTTQVTLNIERAAAPAPQEGTLYVRNNREQSYQYDLTQLLSALDNGKSYGTVNYTLGAVNISGDYYKDGAKITGTTLTLPIQKVEADKEGNIGEVSITITSGNYKDMSAVINVESVDKIPVTITGVSVAEREYNGKAIERTGTPKAVESNGSTAAISDDDYHYTWQTADGKDLSGAPKDAGSYQLTVSVDNGTYIGTSTISFVINKAAITITANSMTVNKGSAKPALTYAISGLAAGEALAAEPTLSCNADMNTAGRYPITVSGAEVPDSNNYHTEITYVPGALTVTASTSGGSSGGGNGGGSGGNNNGNGSGSENNGDGGQGNSSDNGGENTTPGVPSVPAVTDTNQGTDTETTKPGTGNTARPGTGTKPESSTAKEERPGTGIPFIKGEDGKIGWNVIRDEEEKAEEGSVINVDMNGTAVVPGDIFDSIKGRDIKITFDMGNGIVWSVDGKSITTDKADDIDFTVRMGESTIPVEIVNNVTGEHYSIQLSLAHDGEFGFIAVLSVNLGEENAGYFASLYYYNEDTGELEFICADEVAQDGTVSFAFTHASDYVVVVDREVEEESGGIIEDAQPEKTDGNGTVVPESPKTVQEKKNALWSVVAGIIALAGIAFAAVFAWKKKEENESVKEDK